MSDPSIDPTAYAYAPAEGRRSSWPITFGSIAIALGICGSLYAAYKMFSAFIMGNAMKMRGYGTASPPSSTDPALDEVTQAVLENFERWSTISLILNSVLILLGIVLVIAGILLLMRTPAAAPLLHTWAYAKIVVAIGAALVGFLMQQGQIEAMTAAVGAPGSSSPSPSPSSGGPMATPAHFGTMISLVSGIFSIVGVLWTCALPVVILIWLHREVVKMDIASWSSSRSAEG